MKKLYSFICALCIVSCALLQAQTSCATIAEVKALADGAECVYTGTATTTYYDAYNGVVMQDATGAILLQSTYLSEANATTVKAGMEISNVIGTFTKESTSYMTNIKVKKSDIAKIEIKKENVAIEPQVVDFDTYMSNAKDYDGVAVKFENVAIRTVEGTTMSEIYSPSTGNKLTLSFTNIPGFVVPARADVAGFLSADWSGKIFRVGSSATVDAYAYNTINNMKVGIVETTNREYELTDTFAVTNVINLSDSKVIYIQEETSRYNYGLRVVLPTATEVKIGDMITGLCGKFEPYTKGAQQKSATLTQSETKEVKVVASGVQSRVLSNYIYTLTDNSMQNAYMYDGTLLSLSGGVVTKEANGSYFYVIENENGQGKKTIALKVANIEDLSAYEGKVCPVQGVLDVAATYPESPITLILRTTADFLESNVKFASIAELIAAGEPAGTSVTYELENPVLVTYKFTKGGGDNALASYFFMVQDETAGIVISLGIEDVKNIAIGDSIVGVRGVFSNMRGMTTNILDVDEEMRKSIEVKSQNNKIEPIETTFTELLADKAKYSNRVVVVRNVQNNEIEKSNPDGTIWYDYYFTQNSVRLDYTLDAEGKPYFTFYDNMDIIGVVDDRIIGTTYSVWPLNQASIINLDDTPIANLDKLSTIYSKGGIVFVETEVDNLIEVYSVQGRLLHKEISVNTTTIIENINESIVIVRVNGMNYKLIIK